MPAAASLPSQILGGVLVITVPAEMDITVAGQLRAMVLDWCAQGHATAVVDMTDTQVCDPAGMRELALAHHRAEEEGGGLRLVIPAASAVLRVVTMTGLDSLAPCYTTREDALSQAIATVVLNEHAPGRATALAGSSTTRATWPDPIPLTCH